jgi:hypothetical protein
LYGALVFAALAGTAVLAWIPWSHPGHLADRLAETGDVMAGGTLALALIAGLIALQAYAAATGLPDLEFQIWFPFSYANRPVLLAERRYEDETAPLYVSGPGKQISAAIRVRNKSGYSAKNPAVIIRLNGMAFSTDELSSGWSEVDFANTVGTTAVQWDGTSYIHGWSARRVPRLDLYRLHTVPAWGESKFVVELLADGYRREIEIPVRFTTDADSDPEWGKELPASDQPPRWI